MDPDLLPRLSMLLNRALGGHPEETFCCRVWRNTQLRVGVERLLWDILRWVLDLLVYLIYEEDHHCFFQWVNYGARRDYALLPHEAETDPAWSLPPRLADELQRGATSPLTRPEM